MYRYGISLSAAIICFPNTPLDMKVENCAATSSLKKDSWLNEEKSSSITPLHLTTGYVTYVAPCISKEEEQTIADVTLYLQHAFSDFFPQYND